MNINRLDLNYILTSISNHGEIPDTMSIQDMQFIATILIEYGKALAPYNSEGNLLPINLEDYSIERAQKLALYFGMHIVEGASGTVYLDFSKGL